MYKILIKTCSASNNIWNFYQEDGVDYVAASLEDMKPTALTLLKKYGKKNIKIIDQMSGQDMDNADVYIYDSTDNYEELNNRPFINGVEIVGQLSLEDLGIQPAGNYLDQNDLEEIENKINNIDLSAYATNERVDQVEHKVDNINLDNFYTKEETDAKDNERLRGYFWNYDGNSITTGSSLERISKSRYASTFNELSNLWDQIAVGGMHPIEVKDKNNYRAWLMPSGTAGGSTYVVYKYRGQVILNTPSSAADVALYRSYYLEFRVNRSDNKLWEADFLCKEGYEQPSMARVEAYVQEQMVNSSANYAQKDKVLLTDGTIEYTPTSDYNPATKKYVDDVVANIDVPDVDLSDYYNKTEVDDKLLTVDVNVEGLDIYSDEERVIGRWVDGRPLYQKYIYIGELTNGITDTHLDDYGIKAHEVRFHQVYKMGPDGILCLISPQFMSMAGQVIARVLLYQEDSGVNVLRVATGEGMDVEGHTAYAIVTYTKPDDEILLPTSDYYPATKKYVDDAIAGVSGGSGGGVDLTNYYTKAEVDALLQELRNEFVSANNNINDKLETIIYGGE